MESTRSLREVRKQFKERALAESRIPTATPQPSPPMSECEFQSIASVMGNTEDNQSVQHEKNEEERFNKWLHQSGYTPQSALDGTAREEHNNEKPEPSAPPQPIDFLLGSERGEEKVEEKKADVPMVIKPVVKTEKHYGIL